MDHDFWARAWATGRTGFHKEDVNPVLITHAEQWLGAGSHIVFVPLCGRTVDMLWLLERGHRVIGVELVESAVAGFFDQHGLPVTRAPHGPLTRWSSGDLEVLQGDIFELASTPLPERATAVWDRAAMVALPPARRAEYVSVLTSSVVAPGARILLDVFDYDPAEMSGPPFHVPPHDVRSYFQDWSLELLAKRDGAKEVSRPDRPLSRFDMYTWLARSPHQPAHSIL